MNAGEEYQAHKRRSEGVYVLAHEDWEKGLAPIELRLIRLAVMPDIEDTRHNISLRVSLGMALNAAESVAEILGSAVPVHAAFFKWHERPAARKAGRNKIVHTAVFLDRVKSKLSAAGLACAVDLSLTAAMGMMQNYSSKIAFSMPLPRTRNFGRASWSCLPCRIEGSRNKRQAGCRVET